MPALVDRLDGLLFFPVTAFAPDGALDLTTFRAHVRARIDDGAAAVFAACGTGEYHALGLDEYEAVIAAAVEETAGAVPVVAGIGHGTALALEFVRRAERAGADGLLALPPYLVKPSQAGLLRHYTELAEATRLEIIIYARDNAVLDPETVVRLAELPNVVGYKDGLGDVDRCNGSSAPSAPPTRTGRSATSTACPPPNSPGSPTGASASRCTPPPCSASRPTSRSPSTPP